MRTAPSGKQSMCIRNNQHPHHSASVRSDFALMGLSRVQLCRVLITIRITIVFLRAANCYIEDTYRRTSVYSIVIKFLCIFEKVYHTSTDTPQLNDTRHQIKVTWHTYSFLTFSFSKYTNYTKFNNHRTGNDNKNTSCMDREVCFLRNKGHIKHQHVGDQINPGN